MIEHPATALSWPRYTHQPFPAYRFIPGRHPHPTASPQGHSYHRPDAPPAPPPPRLMPQAWKESHEYLFGCDLYNHGYWWEAHEEWEGIWRVEPRDSPTRSFLQGLIQTSAAHLKLLLGNCEAVERLRTTSNDHFQKAIAGIADPTFLGLHWSSFLRELENYFVAALVECKMNAATYPYIRLQ